MKILKEDTYYWWFKNVNWEPQMTKTSAGDRQLLKIMPTDDREHLSNVLKEYPNSLFVEVCQPKFSDQFVNEHIGKQMEQMDDKTKQLIIDLSEYWGLTIPETIENLVTKGNHESL